MSIEYHFVCHLTGENARDMTLLDMNNLISYFEKIRVKRYVVCIEPATHDHLHAVFELAEKRPQIKRDLLNAMSIKTEQYANNATYCKKLKVGQTFELLGGGYLQKGYKLIKTFGISHIELAEGQEAYTQLTERKVIKLSKHNLIRHIVDDLKANDESPDDYRKALMRMMRSPQYNFSYVCNAFTEDQISMLVYYAMTEPNPNDESMLSYFFKENKNLF